MISAQRDELRVMAESIGLAMPQAATLMMDAADTIWELRDDLQRANDAVRDAEHDESMAWDRVRKAEAENAKLRQQLADVTESMGRVEERCAKLRGLVRGLIYATHPADRARLIADAAELGVEVDG